MSDIDSLVRQYKAGALSRRGFFTRVGAFGLLMPAASSLLAMAGPARAQTPSRGGWLRIAQGNTDNTLEPVRMVDTDDGVYSNCVYQRLTRFAPTLEVEGDAAEEWSVNDAATEWSFRLRGGLTFHNGQPVTAADVVESLSRHIAEGSESPAKALLSTVTAIEAPDATTVKITLSSGNADLPVIMSDYHLAIHPAGHTDFAMAIGSGPFKVMEFIPGERVVLERFENYYEEGKPYLDGLDFIPVPDANATLSTLLAGDVDAIRDVPAFAVEQLSGNDAVTLYNTPTGAFTNMVMMVDRAPTDNADFRKGIKHAIDRELILNQVFKGIGTISADTPIGPDSQTLVRGREARRIRPRQGEVLLRQGRCQRHRPLYLGNRRQFGQRHRADLPAIRQGCRRDQRDQDAIGWLLVEHLDAEAHDHVGLAGASDRGCLPYHRAHERRELERNHVGVGGLRQHDHRGARRTGRSQARPDVL
ncbi:MAG: ABC transporter substrate-binding protein [Paracoccaceae bacterium]